MQTLRHVVVLAHLVSFALLFGTWAAQALERRTAITRGMQWGMAGALVTGLALAAPWGLAGDLNYPKIGTKLVVLVVIGALLGIGGARQRRGAAVPSAFFWGIGALTLLNAAIAVLV